MTVMPARSTWALAPAVPMDPDAARREAARRLLRTHGPATHTHLGAWAGCGTAHAKRLVGLVAGELDEVRFGGRSAFVLAEDRRRLEDPPAARGVRLLGGFDPYVAQPDRETLVPDAALARRLFPATGRPGVILVDGVMSGIWKARKLGAKLRLEVEWLPGAAATDLADEAARVAAARGCAAADVRQDALGL